MINREVRYRAVVHYQHFQRSLRKVSRIYGVSKSSLQRWVHQAHFSDGSRPRVRRSAFSATRDCISEHISANPFTTMDELSTVVKDKCGVQRSRSTMSVYRRRAGFTRKRAFRVVDAVHDHARVSSFCEQHLRTSNADLVCIDEAGFYVGDHHRMGYSAIGRRLNILQGRTLRRRKYTLLMAVTAGGVMHYRLMDHNCKKADFVSFISELPLRPGQCLLMDNIAFHHSVETRRAVTEQQCTQLFIPPYSPRFNAIENVFGVIKSAYRRACPAYLRSDWDYRGAIVRVLEEFRQSDLSPYFEHARAQSLETCGVLTRGGAFHGHEN
jgi:transposase